MQINLVQIIVIIVLAALCWYANNQLNPIPILKSVVNVLIVIVSVLLLLQSAGLVSSSSSIVIH